MNTNRHVVPAVPFSLVLSKETLRVLSDPYSPRGPLGSTTDATVTEPTHHCTGWSYCCSTGCLCAATDE
jgi:hypothetical protein